jgi:lysophospholipase L1-like esterase
MFAIPFLLTPQAPIWENVPVDSRLIRIVGRFDSRDSKGPKFSWPASTIELAVQGSGLALTCLDTNEDYWQVEADGIPTQVWHLVKGENSLTVNLEGGKTHQVRLVKRTESYVGTTQLTRVQVAGCLIKPPSKSRRIEIIGDSISCGFGDEGKNDPEGEKRNGVPMELENAYTSYGQTAARELNADGIDIAWSGRKLWPDNTIPEIYDLSVPIDPTSLWNFPKPRPDVILINLGTNDFGNPSPDERGWTNAYEAFIHRLRTHSPSAMIYCAIGSMMGDWDPKTKSLTTIRGYMTRMVARINALGDRRVKLLEFAQQLGADGIGSMWHPSNATHRKMAVQLVEAIKTDLGW